MLKEKNNGEPIATETVTIGSKKMELTIRILPSMKMMFFC